MVARAALEGYLLEEALAELLWDNGYRVISDAKEDEDVLLNLGHGLCLKGRGAVHQVDVLGELLLPTPFSLPTRLILEAKKRAKKTPIDEVRNAHGLIFDVNEFYSTETAAALSVPLKRHLYRYSLVSTSGFAIDAQRYALAHQMTLIDLSGESFTPLVRLAELAAETLVAAARVARPGPFPVSLMRHAIRQAFAEKRDASENRRTRLRRDDVVQAPQWMAASLDAFTAGLEILFSQRELLLGFPEAPFVLALVADDIEQFNAYVASLPVDVSEVRVNIQFSADSRGRLERGDWVLTPAEVDSRVGGFTLRFDIPELLADWLLSDDDLAHQRASQAKRALLKQIHLFPGGRRLALEYVPMREASTRHPERTRDWEADDLLIRAQAPRFERPSESPTITRREWQALTGGEGEPWNAELAADLVAALDSGRQQVLLQAALQGGWISREQTYELMGFSEHRSLRGFTRPFNRVAGDLKAAGRLSADAPVPLVAVYGETPIVEAFRLAHELLLFVGRDGS